MLGEADAPSGGGPCGASPALLRGGLGSRCSSRKARGAEEGEERKGRRGRGAEEGEEREGSRGRGGEEGEGKRAVYKTRCISSYVATAKCSRHSNIVLHNDS